jgi:hypothetical protein
MPVIGFRPAPSRLSLVKLRVGHNAVELSQQLLVEGQDIEDVMVDGFSGVRRKRRNGDK